MPTFFDLDKYVALWRSRALVHVYTKESFVRGRFAFFNVDRKKVLYVNGKKFYNYSATKANFVGDFKNGYTVDEEAYRQKKKDSLNNAEDDSVSHSDKVILQRNVLFKILNRQYKLPQSKISKLLEAETGYFVSRETITKGIASLG